MNNVQNNTKISASAEVKAETPQKIDNPKIELLKACLGTIKTTIANLAGSKITNGQKTDTTINSQVISAKVEKNENTSKVSAEKMEKYREALRLMKCEQDKQSWEVVSSYRKSKAKNDANNANNETSEGTDEPVVSSKEKNGDAVINESLSKKYLTKAESALNLKNAGSKQAGRYTFQEI